MGGKNKAKAEVWCRGCGKKMKQYPYDILFFYCSDCKLKARVDYEKMKPLESISKNKLLLFN